MKLVCAKKAAPIYLEPTAYEGVSRIAGKVCEDIEKVSGVCPELVVQEDMPEKEGILVATAGRSALLERLEEDGMLITSDLKGLYEVYRIATICAEGREILVIAGSDKRGTIYGLFALSEAIGVTPWGYWADVMPQRKEEVTIPEELLKTSKEPSVRYRGFFINDEFPSFGNWTMEKFGGFTAEMYDKVFELLLRLKGNYLWPAMWVSSFPLDGPGLLNAELADLYGVVIGNSHHEPCLRASEEWDKVRGEDSIYGNEWNYVTNREGLLRYWEDGLKRSGKYEGIITVGMRGERDSMMLGPDATLAENIDLLKDIITEQKKLIQKHVDEDLSRVSLMLALYKEVEAYYYGDETTPGLKDWDGLDGITLMLCEDNYGNMRTLPTEEMRSHRGGFGMYYHFDYHGGPISYEWVNSTPIAKVWEQMSEAYEYGIRDIWIVNVGDLKPQEFPLSYFMNLAYDFDTFGTSAPNQTWVYTQRFVENQFAGAFQSNGQMTEQNWFAMAAEVLEEYTRINGMRRPEALCADVYHPVHFDENRRMYKRAERLSEKCNLLREMCKEEMLPAFIELVYFPALASANLLKMQLAAGMNAFYAKEGWMVANSYADIVEEAIAYDKTLTEEYNSVADGKWNHMMSSNHVGFVNWNDEGWSYPEVTRVKQKQESCLGIRIVGEEEIKVVDAQHSAAEHTCSVSCKAGTLTIEILASSSQDLLKEQEFHRIHYCDGKPGNEELIKVDLGQGREYRLRLIRVAPKLIAHISDKVSKEGAYIVWEAGEFTSKTKVEEASYKLLTDYGRVKETLKVFPCTRSFMPEEAVAHNSPEVIYEVEACSEGDYTLTLHVSPTNPRFPGDPQRIAVGVSEKMQVISTLPAGFDAGNCHNPQWNENVLDNIRKIDVKLHLSEGINRIHVAAVDAGVMLQRMVLCAPMEEVPVSYLGPLC